MNDDLNTSIQLLLSARCREQYLPDETLVSPRRTLSFGRLMLESYGLIQKLAHHMNLQRDLRESPDMAVKPGELNAFGLMTEVFEVIVDTYGHKVQPTVLGQWNQTLGDLLGEPSRDRVLGHIAELFPPFTPPDDTSTEDVLERSFGGTSNRERALITLLLLWVSNQNPACRPFADLFEQEGLEVMTGYDDLIGATHQFFETQPSFGPDEQSLVEMLLAPGNHAPESLLEQLEFIHNRWRSLLDERLLNRLLLAQNRLKEDWKWAGPPTPSGPVEAPHFAPDVPWDGGRFAREAPWKPRLILIAKNVRVWLDQLSKTHGCWIRRLDEIPDEALDQLANWGFSGLWLIGLWERSPASARIKQLAGNPEAVGSAYSLYDYIIAADLGGEMALDILKAKCDVRGIRLAADMVPNHVGILSRWAIEHPDWFIHLDYPPFPNYRYEGPDLSDDPHVGIFIEDGYWHRTDAAVAFKRLDRHTGHATYIYHGNDGTQMPWNDTAQLDFRKPEVRRAVIDVILKVLQRFPFLRFDAAMTLTKFHYQRLWFPEPGSGAAIPSRAQYGLTHQEFDQAIPKEFWREVVDAVNEKMPDSLLMAEAFWLTEEFFIRTLGMHRVYNSAFMNMLRNEDNDKYRAMMKDILLSDPEVLYQLVNFMTNPDEETAVAGFGKGDKYFGILTVMVTLPGLPMYGHGQIEGFEEKYGMEYPRAYRDERPDGHLVERHQAEVFTLMRQRDLFAGVEHFQLYDFYREDGSVDENVFAFSNRLGDRWALVLYNNRLDSTRGWIRHSVPKVYWLDNQRQVRQLTIAEAVGLQSAAAGAVSVQETRTKTDHQWKVQQLHERGLFVDLPGYQCRIFMGSR